MSRFYYRDSALIGVTIPCSFQDDDLSFRLKQRGYGFLRLSRTETGWLYYGSLVNCKSAIVMSIAHNGTDSSPTDLYVSGVASALMTEQVFLESCLDSLLSSTGMKEIHTRQVLPIISQIEARWKHAGSLAGKALTARAEESIDFSRWQANRF